MLTSFRLVLLFFVLVSTPIAYAQERPTHYERREKHDRDGIGIFFMGREIAQVMGHQGAEWLERPEREAEENAELLVDLLQFQPGEVVADIGAGTGYIARKISRRVGTNGVVYGVEIQQEMLDILANKSAQAGLHNIKPVLGTLQNPKLPQAAVDTIIMVDVYHELNHPYEMTQAMITSLKPGGRLVFVEYRSEDPAVPIKHVHKMSEAQIKKEMSLHPLVWEQTLSKLPRQHVAIFRKKRPAPAAAKAKAIAPQSPPPSPQNQP